jgi:pimeloyl-ACP methyl ester carboxylesterase
MQHLGVARAHVVGYSYGGAIALQLALDTPEAVHSLALLEPALMNVPSAPKLMEAIGPVVQMYEAGNRSGAIDSFLQTVLGPDYRIVPDRALPGAFAQALTDAETFFRFEIPALEQWSFTQADAGRITQPILAVRGANSHKLWPGFMEIHQLVQAWFPQVETFVLERATHGLQMMNPKGMAEELASFFGRHPLPHQTNMIFRK